MKITKYGSATVLIETPAAAILCDPWLTDGIYYGAWCNYPPIDLSQCDFSGVDYIYISHVHPDHFDPKTMELISKDTPVLIHRYHQKFLKANIERLGFNVVELPNGQPYQLKDGTKFSIYAADNCDPSICGHMFGCIASEIKGSMQLDSLCVIDDGEFVLVNTNDCPYGISKNTLKRITKEYPKVDFALVGYTSASLYPHCMMDYTDAQMQAGIEKAKMTGLSTGLNTIKELKPRYYIPFAGTYILGGKYFHKNKNLPVNEIQDAVAYFQSDPVVGKSGCKPVMLNFKEYFDLESEKQSSPYVPIDKNAREQYIENVVSQFSYTFEADPWPGNDELLELFDIAVERLKKRQALIGFFEDLDIIFDVNDGLFVSVNLRDPKPRIIDNINGINSYHRFKLDPRLLKLALKGPRYANWNNIEIGALLGFSRKPDVYRKDVHTLINSMHV